MGRVIEGHLTGPDALRLAVEAHLQSNLYPPPGPGLADACLEAIDLCARSVVEEDEALQFEDVESLPAWYVERGAPLTAWHVVEGLRLEAFVDAAVAEEHALACELDGSEGVLS